MFEGLDMEGRGWWLMAYLLVLFIVVFSNAARGWEAGLWRSGMGLLSIFMGYIAAILLSAPTASLLGLFIEYPRIILLKMGMVSGFIVWGIGMLGSLVLPKTADVPDKGKAVIYAFGGAVIGGFNGLFYMIIFTLMLHFMGVVSEIRMGFESASKDAVFHEQAYREGGVRSLGDASKKSVLFFVRMKNTIEGSMLEPFVDAVNPIPEKAERLLAKVKQISTDQEAMRLFLEHPLSQDFLKHPDIIALSKDKEVMELARNRQINALLRHPKLHAVCENPELLAKIENFDLEQAMDDALTQAGNK